MLLSENAYNALEDAKGVLIYDIYRTLKDTPGGRTDINVDFLNNYDGDAEIDGITSVYIKDNTVFVDYFDSQTNDLSDPIELFTIDTIVEIIEQL